MNKSITTPLHFTEEVRKFFSDEGFFLAARDRRPGDADRYFFDIWCFDPDQKPVQQKILFISQKTEHPKIKIGLFQFRAVVREEHPLTIPECSIEVIVKKYVTPVLSLAEKINKECNIVVVISI